MYRIWLKEARAKAGISQTELAESVDSTVYTMGAMERGEVNPSISLACAIVWYFKESGIDIDVMEFIEFESQNYWSNKNEKNL